ncbi:MAG: hypothetical protein WC197_09365, partial [Candidatus Gastranaerophilaceae bacterium]
MSKKEKIVSFPRMGHIHIPVKAILETMGAKICLPPENNKKTLDIGLKHSTEGVCLPYKLNLGNYIQALENGANTLLMFQAPGTCRLGNYTSMAAESLKTLGYEFEMIVFDMYQGKMKSVMDKFSYVCGGANIINTVKGFRLGFEKFYALDILEKKLFYTRPRAINHNQPELVYNKGLNRIDKANSIKDIKMAVKTTLNEFENVEIQKNKYVPTVFITGEFFVLLDPFSNMDIEKELGILGVEVQRQIMFSDWLEHVLKPGFLYKKQSHRQRSTAFAQNYMTRVVGGECLEVIGDAVYAAKNNIDGVIHIGPFNCTPEIVSQNILTKDR